MNIKVFLHSSETKALLCISINFELEMHCDERGQRGKNVSKRFVFDCSYRLQILEANRYLNDNFYISKIGWSICTFER